MSIISTRTKSRVGIKAAKSAAKRPKLLLTGTRIAVPASKAGLRARKSVLKRRTRRPVDQLDRASRSLGDALAVYAPKAAYDLGLAEPPKRKRTAPRVAAGVVIGASAVYFLEPEHGKEHRQKVAQVIG